MTLPLPVRIVIPVANPATAEELIHLGGDLLEARSGELTALGIVEVPEGMPLSEGATRARHARRLLQRVLDFAPEGTPIHPIVRIGRHAAEGIIEAAAELDADLIVFGWGGKVAASRDGLTAPVLTDDRRGDARGPVRHRGRQAARRAGDQAGHGARPRRPARRARDALRGRDRPTPRRGARGPPHRAAGDHPRGPGPGRTSAAGLRQAARRDAAPRWWSAKPPTSATPSSAKPTGPTWS